MSFKMKRKEKPKEFVREIEIPEGVEVEIEGNEMKVSKGEEKVEKRLYGVLLGKNENKIIIKTKRATKREKKQINTIVAHINNMLKGVQEKFVYKLQICAVHFPMNVSIKDREVVIKNFLGETKERKVKINPEAEVKIEKEIITVESANKEIAGQTAASIEKTTKIKNKDIRIFQDGIFMIEKAGEKL